MLLERLGKELLYFDGGMGTLLQSKGLQPGELPEVWNLEHAEEIVDIHKSYFEAGSDIVLSNTFGANAIKFHDSKYGLKEIVTAGIQNAKKAAELGVHDGRTTYVALDVGPTGKLLKPMGDLSFEDAYEAFKETMIYGEEAGADLIELGIPFSDPTAEGPVIQEANVRALAGGVTTDKVFSMVEKIRKNTKIPMVFMTYANVVFSYGTERFIKKAAEVGMDGLILPDVPFEEKEEFDVVCKQYGLDLISLIAPTSHERIAMIEKEAEGFVYCVSSLGVTGMRTSITTDVGAMVKLVKAQKDIPCAVGFGISTPEQAKKMAAQSDGAIVGSAIVKLCGAYGKDGVPKVKAYVKEMKDAIR